MMSERDDVQEILKNNPVLEREAKKLAVLKESAKELRAIYEEHRKRHEHRRAEILAKLEALDSKLEKSRLAVEEREREVAAQQDAVEQLLYAILKAQDAS
jgi:hypothetical protein